MTSVGDATKEEDNMSPHIIVAGGGTAGHIEPALAVAEALKERGATVAALGTTRGLETTLVPQRGFQLELIDPVPVPRKPSVDLFKLPGRLIKTIRQTRNILKAYHADAVIGFGGYVSAPAYIAARSLKIPFFVHEANASAGMANKLGIRLGGTGLNAVADSGIPGEVVGIPLRQSLKEDPVIARQRALNTWGLDANKPTVLVTGGSQGAASLNRAVAGGIDRVLAAGIQVLHSVGKKNSLPDAKAGYVPLSYIDDMAAAYAVADLIVCRAGAMTVAENTQAGVPAVYIPLPHGNGEQGRNATAIVEAGGARIIQDADFDGDAFATQVTEILGNQETLEKMRAVVRGSGLGNASAVIAGKILAAAEHRG